MAIQKVISTFGTLDVALNNAGIGGEANKVGDLSEKAWLKVINIKSEWRFQLHESGTEAYYKQKKGVINKYVFYSG